MRFKLWFGHIQCKVACCVGLLMRTRTQHWPHRVLSLDEGRHPLPRLGRSAIFHETYEGAILYTRHTGRVDFRRERMPAPTSLEGTFRDEGMRQSWTYDFGAKSRPVQPGVHSGCAEYSTRAYAGRGTCWSWLSSWYGPRLSEILDVPTSAHHHFSRVFVAS